MDGQDGGRHDGADGDGGNYGHDGAYGDDGHTRDFLSPAAAFPPGFPYNPVYPLRVWHGVVEQSSTKSPGP
jgi:hypothetical protein